MNDRVNPLLSVIIPTREQPETLLYTLRTALDQASQNFEVIVSDNFSQDNTAQVVRSFSDPRLRLINPGRRLPMCDHWDFALLHAAGDYVMFLGGDDALIPEALDKLETSILNTPCLVYCWPRPIYIWPMDGKPARVTHLPSTTQAFEINLQNLAKQVVSMGGWRWPLIPSMYHSAVAKRIPDAIREKTGRVFHSTSPDIFMSMAVPAFAKTAINLGYCITVAGQSDKSNSGAMGRRERHDYFKRFIQEYGDYKIHPSLLPEAPIGLNLLVDSFLVAMDKFPEFYGGMKFNYDAMWALLCRLNYSDKLKYNLTRLGIIRSRQRIRRFHPFHVSRFLLYAAFHLPPALRRQMRTRMLNFRRKASHPPDNIYDFVKTLALR